MKGAIAWVGVLHLEIGCAGPRSLKEKRALLQPLLHRWRSRYSLSVTRLAGLDAHDWELVALAAIDGDRDRLTAVLTAAEAAVADAGLVVLRGRLDVEPWDGLDPGEGSL